MAPPHKTLDEIINVFADAKAKMKELKSELEDIKSKLDKFRKDIDAAIAEDRKKDGGDVQSDENGSVDVVEQFRQGLIRLTAGYEPSY
ncbi:hypothetical protein ACLMJK_000936 [Lecanora helva]